MDLKHLGRCQIEAAQMGSPYNMRLHRRRDCAATGPLVNAVDRHPPSHDCRQVCCKVGTARPASNQVVDRRAMIHAHTLMDVSSILQDGRNINWCFLHFGDDLQHG